MVAHRSPRNLPAVSDTVSVPDNLIEMRNVIKTFKNAAGEFVVLKGIDLTIKRGDFAAVVG